MFSMSVIAVLATKLSGWKKTDQAAPEAERQMNREDSCLLMISQIISEAFPIIAYLKIRAWSIFDRTISCVHQRLT